MKTRMLVSIFILIFALIICVHLPVYADRGSISFKPDVQIFEPNQRAMIAWNGVEEILLLTTDLHASESTRVLEVIPLPSEPVVKKGDIKIFKKAIHLINKHLRKEARRYRGYPSSPGTMSGGAEEIEPAGEITFHKKIGAHDISVAHVLHSHGFIEWVDTYLKSAGVENPKIPEELKIVIAEYIEEGFGWFVFDVVQLEREPKTNDAIQYRFKTDFLYYPLKITRSAEGYTTIDLLILIPKIPSNLEYEFTGISKSKIYFPHRPISLTSEELRYLNEEMYYLFKQIFKQRGYKSYLRIWQITGKLSSFEEDLIVGVDETSALEYASEEGYTEVVKLLIESGVDVDTRIGTGYTALMLALIYRHPDTAKLLIKAGADVNAQDDHGNTVLMHAARRLVSGYPEIIKLLIEAGADVNAQTRRGTALSFAKKRVHGGIVKLLREAGAKE